MQLWFQVAGGGGGYVKIYDEATQGPFSDFDAGAAAPNVMPVWEPDFTGVGQEDQLFTVPDDSGKTVVSSFRQPLSNVSAQAPVTLIAAYATRDAAIASIAIFAALLEMKVHFKLVQGAEVQYYPNAVVSRYKPTAQGLSCTHSFTFKSDTVTHAAPP